MSSVCMQSFSSFKWLQRCSSRANLPATAVNYSRHLSCPPSFPCRSTISFCRAVILRSFSRNCSSRWFFSVTSRYSRSAQASTCSSSHLFLRARDSHSSISLRSSQLSSPCSCVESPSSSFPSTALSWLSSGAKNSVLDFLEVWRGTGPKWLQSSMGRAASGECLERKESLLILLASSQTRLMAIPSSFFRRNRLFQDLAVSSNSDSPHSLPLPTFFCVMKRDSAAELASSPTALPTRPRLMLLSRFLAEGLLNILVWSGLRLRNLLEEVASWRGSRWCTFGSAFLEIVREDCAGFSDMYYKEIQVGVANQMSSWARLSSNAIYLLAFAVISLVFKV